MRDTHRDWVLESTDLFGTVVYKHVAGHVNILPTAPVLHQRVAQQHLELFALVFPGLSVAVRQVQGQHGQ